MATQLNAHYDIPRVQVQLPGRQNRLTSGELRISPSMTEPILFRFGNPDGVPLNLLPFAVHFTVWEKQSVSFSKTTLAQGNTIINKKIPVDDPYAGEVLMVLSEDETIEIAHNGTGSDLRWSLFMINEDGEVFPTSVGKAGQRNGTICLDLADGMPMAEVIRTPTQ